LASLLAKRIDHAFIIIFTGFLDSPEAFHFFQPLSCFEKDA
jgi:hypothetical protein